MINRHFFLYHHRCRPETRIIYPALYPSITYWPQAVEIAFIDRYTKGKDRQRVTFLAVSAPRWDATAQEV